MFPIKKKKKIPVLCCQAFSYQKDRGDKIHSHNFREKKNNIARRSTPDSRNCKKELHQEKKKRKMKIVYI